MDQDLMIFTSQSYGGLILWNFWTRLVNADVRLTPMRGAWVNTRPCWPALHRPCLPRGRCTRRAFFENWPTGCLSAGRQGRCSVAGYGYEVNKTSVSETIRKVPLDEARTTLGKYKYGSICPIAEIQYETASHAKFHWNRAIGCRVTAKKRL